MSTSLDTFIENLLTADKTKFPAHTIISKMSGHCWSFEQSMGHERIFTTKRAHVERLLMSQSIAQLLNQVNPIRRFKE